MDTIWRDILCFQPWKPSGQFNPHFSPLVVENEMVLKISFNPTYAIPWFCEATQTFQS